MQSKIDTTFQTMQRDLFESGIVAAIGPNAFAVWQSIKAHADFNTGEAWPGMRRIGEMTGLSLGAVHKAVDVLQVSHLLRVVTKGNRSRGSTYIARERMDVRLGDRVLCTIVIDYVPAKLRKTIEGIADAIQGDRTRPEAFADCEIIPGDGFVWDAERGVLRASIKASEVPEGDAMSFPQIPSGAQGILLI
jgi:hypothetical protein